MDSKEINNEVTVLDESEAQKLGIKSNYRIMPSGEKRFGLVARDGSAYNRTEAPEDGAAWQNSHMHSAIKEMYIVQKGFIVFAELENGQLKLKKMDKNDYYMSRPGVPHNVYMADGAVTHCVKYGETDKSDWIPSTELDALTKHLFADKDFSILDDTKYKFT